jgi:hypothetical protein
MVILVAELVVVGTKLDSLGRPPSIQQWVRVGAVSNVVDTVGTGPIVVQSTTTYSSHVNIPSSYL